DAGRQRGGAKSVSVAAVIRLAWLCRGRNRGRKVSVVESQQPPPTTSTTPPISARSPAGVDIVTAAGAVRAHDRAVMLVVVAGRDAEAGVEAAHRRASPRPAAARGRARRPPGAGALRATTTGARAAGPSPRRAP